MQHVRKKFYYNFPIEVCLLHIDPAIYPSNNLVEVKVCQTKWLYNVVKLCHQVQHIICYFSSDFDMFSNCRSFLVRFLINITMKDSFLKYKKNLHGLMIINEKVYESKLTRNI